MQNQSHNYNNWNNKFISFINISSCLKSAIIRPPLETIYFCVLFHQTNQWRLDIEPSQPGARARLNSGRVYVPEWKPSLNQVWEWERDYIKYRILSPDRTGACIHPVVLNCRPGLFLRQKLPTNKVGATIVWAARSITTALYALHFHLNLHPHVPDSAYFSPVHSARNCGPYFKLTFYIGNDKL